MTDLLIVRLKSPNTFDDAVFYWTCDKTNLDKSENFHILDTLKWILNDVDELQDHELIDLLNSTSRNNYEEVLALSIIYNQKITKLKDEWSINKYCPKFLSRKASMPHLRHIMQLCYNRAVSNPELLNQYLPFSPEVYGETSFDLIQHMVSSLKPQADDSFIDLGSGVGQVVLQVAASTNLKKCIGIEKSDIPAKYAEKMDQEFKWWMQFYGKPYQPYELLKGDFFDDDFKENIDSASLIFVNNFAFGPTVDHQLKTRFIDLKDGVKIISSKAFCPFNFRITDRNLSDIGSILQVSSLSPIQGAVSWTPKPFSYHIHKIDRSLLELYFARLKDSRHKSMENLRQDRRGRLRIRQSKELLGEETSQSGTESSSFMQTPNLNGFHLKNRGTQSLGNTKQKLLISTASSSVGKNLSKYNYETDLLSSNSKDIDNSYFISPEQKRQDAVTLYLDSVKQSLIGHLNSMTDPNYYSIVADQLAREKEKNELLNDQLEKLIKETQELHEHNLDLLLAFAEESGVEIEKSNDIQDEIDRISKLRSVTSNYSTVKLLSEIRRLKAENKSLKAQLKSQSSQRHREDSENSDQENCYNSQFNQQLVFALEKSLSKGFNQQDINDFFSDCLKSSYKRHHSLSAQSSPIRCKKRSRITSPLKSPWNVNLWQNAGPADPLSIVVMPLSRQVTSQTSPHRQTASTSGFVASTNNSCTDLPTPQCSNTPRGDSSIRAVPASRNTQQSERKVSADESRQRQGRPPLATSSSHPSDSPFFNRQCGEGEPFSHAATLSLASAAQSGKKEFVRCWVEHTVQRAGEHAADTGSQDAGSRIDRVSSRSSTSAGLPPPLLSPEQTESYTGRIRKLLCKERSRSPARTPCSPPILGPVTPPGSPPCEDNLCSTPGRLDNEHFHKNKSASGRPSSSPKPSVKKQIELMATYYKLTQVLAEKVKAEKVSVAKPIETPSIAVSSDFSLSPPSRRSRSRCPSRSRSTSSSSCSDRSGHLSSITYNKRRLKSNKPNDCTAREPPFRRSRSNSKSRSRKEAVKRKSRSPIESHKSARLPADSHNNPSRKAEEYTADKTLTKSRNTTPKNSGKITSNVVNRSESSQSTSLPTTSPLPVSTCQGMMTASSGHTTTACDPPRLYSNHQQIHSSVRNCPTESPNSIVTHRPPPPPPPPPISLNVSNLNPPPNYSGNLPIQDFITAPNPYFPPLSLPNSTQPQYMPTSNYQYSNPCAMMQPSGSTSFQNSQEYFNPTSLPFSTQNYSNYETMPRSSEIPFSHAQVQFSQSAPVMSHTSTVNHQEIPYHTMNTPSRMPLMVQPPRADVRSSAALGPKFLRPRAPNMTHFSKPFKNTFKGSASNLIQCSTDKNLSKTEFGGSKPYGHDGMNNQERFNLSKSLTHTTNATDHADSSYSQMNCNSRFIVPSSTYPRHNPNVLGHLPLSSPPLNSTNNNVSTSQCKSNTNSSFVGSSKPLPPSASLDGLLSHPVNLPNSIITHSPRLPDPNQHPNNMPNQPCFQRPYPTAFNQQRFNRPSNSAYYHHRPPTQNGPRPIRGRFPRQTF